MRTSAARAPVRVRRLSPPHDLRAELAADIGEGMLSVPKRIPSKYFYDEVGSRLFEEITKLPEYYLTRVETEILTRYAGEIMEASRPVELVELGSGSSVKTRLLLDAMLALGEEARYLPLDVSGEALRAAVQALCDDYPNLAIEGLIGDYEADLALVPRCGPSLVSFLGSTIGNFDRAGRVGFLRKLAGILEPSDSLLVGFDMVKDVSTMVRAYDDSQRLTGSFTLNILEVVNRELGADFPLDAFVHRPVWNAEESRMEAWLETTRALEVRIGHIDLVASFEAGEGIHVEVSTKFTRDMVVSELDEAGLALRAWYTDSQGWFALALASPKR